MRPSVAGLVVALGLTATLLAGRASAHVAPAVDVNNRYLKLTLLPDRVRLAYTVYFGEMPGAVQRRTLDRDRDGLLSDAEADAFGAVLAAQVRPAIQLTIDDTPSPTTWALVDVGLGTPTVRAGSFSVDLVAWYCLPAGPRHTVVMRDRYLVPRPGETEVRIEDGPGVHLADARLGDVPLSGADARWDGAGGPITVDGVTVRFDVAPDATRPRDGICGAPVDRPVPVWRIVAAGAAAIAAATGAAAWWWRRRRRGAPAPDAAA